MWSSNLFWNHSNQFQLIPIDLDINRLKAKSVNHANIFVLNPASVSLKWNSSQIFYRFLFEIELDFKIFRWSKSDIYWKFSFSGYRFKALSNLLMSRLGFETKQMAFTWKVQINCNPKSMFCYIKFSDYIYNIYQKVLFVYIKL